MTHRRTGRLNRLASLFLIGCVAAAQATAQTDPVDQGAPAAGARAGNDLPTAREIWRHLPDQPRQAADPRPVPDPQALPDPTPVALPRPERPLPNSTAAVRQSTLSGARVVIHYSERSGPARSQQIARRLRDAGAGAVEMRAVGFRVGRQSIRYFHDADRAVSETLGQVIGSGRNAGVGDFTHFRPLPSVGTVEIWVP